MSLTAERAITACCAEDGKVQLCQRATSSFRHLLHSPLWKIVQLKLKHPRCSSSSEETLFYISMKTWVSFQRKNGPGILRSHLCGLATRRYFCD